MIMIRITDKLISKVSKKAGLSKRKRSNYNFHNTSSDNIQRFLNALEPGTYLRPHKHENPDKVEVFLILSGRVMVIEFDDHGNIIDHILLDPNKGNWGVEIPPKTWHSFVVLKEGSVLYEIKEGPYVEETDKIFAKWAPEEGSKEAQQYKQELIDLIIKE
jgi:cupin fold WbuC family metalloprotein